MPSSTVLSGADSWITVDAAVGNDKFHFNHAPLRLDGLAVTAPDGSAAEAENLNRGKLRSTFDLQLKQSGTYRVAVVNDGVFARWKEDGKPKRYFGKPRAWPRPCLPRPTSWKSRKAWAASRPSSPPASPAPSSPWAEAWNWRPSRTRTTCTRARPPPSRCCWTASPPRTWK